MTRTSYSCNGQAQKNDPVLYVPNIQSGNFDDTERMKVDAKKNAMYIIAILEEQIRGLNAKRRRVPKKMQIVNSKHSSISGGT